WARAGAAGGAGDAPAAPHAARATIGRRRPSRSWTRRGKRPSRSPATSGQGSVTAGEPGPHQRLEGPGGHGIARGRPVHVARVVGRRARRLLAPQLLPRVDERDPQLLAHPAQAGDHPPPPPPPPPPPS